MGYTNHLLFMADLKIFWKNEREVNGLVSAVNLFSSDIGMDFGTKKCGKFVWRKWIYIPWNNFV